MENIPRHTRADVEVYGKEVYKSDMAGVKRQVGACTSVEAAQAVARLMSDFKWPYSHEH